MAVPPLIAHAAPRAAAAPPAEETPGVDLASPENATLPAAASCPPMTLQLNTLEIYSAVVNNPQAWLVVQCFTDDGVQFPGVSFPTQTAVMRGVLGAAYNPEVVVARLTCGQAMSCRVGAKGSVTGPWVLLAAGGCLSDYRRFIDSELGGRVLAGVAAAATLPCTPCSLVAFPCCACLGARPPHVALIDPGWC